MADLSLIEGHGLSSLFEDNVGITTADLPMPFSVLGWQITRGSQTTSTSLPRLSLADMNGTRRVRLVAPGTGTNLGMFLYRSVRKLPGKMVLGFGVTDAWKDGSATSSPSTTSMAYVGFYPSASPDGSNYLPIAVRRGSDGLLEVSYKVGTTTTSVIAPAGTFLAGAVNWIELIVDFTTPKIELWCNSIKALEISITAAAAKAYNDLTYWFIGMGANPRYNPGQYSFIGEINAGPIYVGDTRLGRCQVKTQFPTADALTDWNREDGDSNFAKVADRNGSDGDNTYVVGMLPGTTDLYTSTDPLGLGNERIHGVAVTAIARKEDVGTKQVAPVIKPDGAADPTVGRSMQLSLANYVAAQTAWAANPRNGSIWTVADMTSLQFGARLTE